MLCDFIQVLVCIVQQEIAAYYREVLCCLSPRFLPDVNMRRGCLARRVEELRYWNLYATRTTEVCHELP